MPASSAADRREARRGALLRDGVHGEDEVLDARLREVVAVAAV